MNTIFEQIKNSTLAWWILSIFSIAGVVLTIYFFVVDKKKQRFAMVYSSFEIIKQGKKSIQNLSLSFAGQTIHNLTITNFAIWNSSNKIIHGTDIVPTQKLRIIADGAVDSLEAQIVAESDNSNCFEICDSSNKQICLDFDYADSRDGIVLQVLHTGSVDSLKVDYKIKGGKPIKCLGTGINQKTTALIGKRMLKKTLAVASVVEVVLMFLMMSVLTLSEMGLIPRECEHQLLFISSDTTPVIIMLWFLVLCALGMAIKILRYSFLLGVPRKLKSFGNSFDE